MYLLNAFSLNMLEGGVTATFTPLKEGYAKLLASRGFDSAVGHKETADLFSAILGMPVPCVRATISIPERYYGMPPWTALVGQYSGPRLEEGTTTLPEGAVIKWFSVYIA